MLIRLAFAAAALLGSGSLADVCVEKTETLPGGWMEIEDKVNASEPYSFSIALKQPKMKGLRSLLMAVDANMLSLADANNMRAPSPDAVRKVQGWLLSHGIMDTEVKNDWINVKATVGQTDALIGSVLKHYIYEGESTPVLRTTQYCIPDHLKYDIDFIYPASNFMRPVRSMSKIKWLDETDLGKRQDAAPACSLITTPECVRKAYNFNYTTPDDKSSVTLGVTGFLGEYANYVDAQDFLKQQAPQIWAKGYNFSVELVNGGENPQAMGTAGGEAALDVDYALSLAYPAKIVFYSTGGRSALIAENGTINTSDSSTNEPYIELFEHLLSKPDGELPSVLSISYSDDEVSVPRPYAEKVCDMIGVLACRGTTVLFGSGDGGSQGGRNSNCRTRDGKDKKIAMTTFPSTCPWAVAVGAVTNARTTPPEAAEFSTGGFSQYFAQPDWQKDAVAGYLAQLDGNLTGYYEPKNRAIPDISAIGTNVLVRVNGRPGLLQGTSASTPMIAAMLAMINDARARANKRPLGFVNKYLYSDKVRGTLLDVTKGQSRSCAWPDAPTPGGWPAKEGWDAVTGLGVPRDFTELLDALLHVDD